MNKTITTAITVFTISICSMSHPVQAQDAPKESSQSHIMLGITGGFSSPTGNYIKIDYSDPKSGFAGAGYNVGIIGTWWSKNHFGIGALVSYHQYAVKGMQQMALGFQGGFDVDSASVTSKGNNHTLNVLVGPYYTFPVTDKLHIDLRMLGGLVFASLAGNDVWLEDSDKLFNFSQNTATATTFGWQGGLGVRYDITTHFGASLNADYFWSKPKFNITNVNRNNMAGREITAYNEPITGLNTNISFYFLLK